MHDDYTILTLRMDGCYTGLNSLQKHLMNTWIFVKIYSIFSLYDNYTNKKAFFSYSFMSALRKWMLHNRMSLCSLYNEFVWIQMRFASYHRSLLIRNDKMRFHVQRLPASLSLSPSQLKQIHMWLCLPFGKHHIHLMFSFRKTGQNVPDFFDGTFPKLRTCIFPLATISKSYFDYG